MNRGRFPYCCSADAINADVIEGLYGSITDLMEVVKRPMSVRGYDTGPMAPGIGDGGAVFIIVSTETSMTVKPGDRDYLRGEAIVKHLVKHEDAKLVATWKTIHGNYNMYLVGWYKERTGADAHD